MTKRVRARSNLPSEPISRITHFPERPSGLRAADTSSVSARVGPV